MSIRSLSLSTIGLFASGNRMSGPVVNDLSFAEISNTATGTYTDGDKTYRYWTFTANGTLTVSGAGVADVLVVAGGGGGSTSRENRESGGAGGGCVRFGMFELSAGSISVTVGAGGSVSAGTDGFGGTGGTSSLGSILKAGGGWGAFAASSGYTVLAHPGRGGGGSSGADSRDTANSFTEGGGQGGTVYGAANVDGVTLNYTGSSVEYGRGGNGSQGAVNTGGGGAWSPTAGRDGIVVVRVQI